MIDKSFQLLRTNPLLTTNFKIFVDTEYNLYLGSIDSNKELKSLNYKHFSINKESYLEDQLPKFYNELPINKAFDIKYDDDNDIIYADYKNQFDDIYYSGSHYVEDKWYNEEFEYFSPLYIRKGYIPVGFIILRIDDPTVYDKKTIGYEIGGLNRTNFREEIIGKWKCVKYFDLTENSELGYWLNKNINDNERFPIAPFEWDVRKLNFSRWYGMDYTTGVYTEKSKFLDKDLELNNPHFRLEKLITEGYRDNHIIFPNILNLSFLFDDTPATPNELKRYSINRYLGFYVDDLEFVTNLTSYVTPQLTSGTTLFHNIVISGETGLTWDICDKDYDPYVPSINPFTESWNDDKNYYIYIKDDLHQVQRFIDSETNRYVYKIISEEILDEYWNTGNTYCNTINIIYTGISYSYIEPLDSNFIIDPYIDCDGITKSMYNDLYLIKINDVLHILKNGSGLTTKFIDDNNTNALIGKYFIQSDYAIISTDEELKYWIVGDNTEYYKEIDIENINRKPLVYSIYKLRLSDIKDFDYEIVNTKFTDFDYEQSEYVDTLEEKIYANDYKDNSYPRSKRIESEGTAQQYKISIVSSEYSADDELFEISKSGDITDIWRKNQCICKWGFVGSINNNDYPYKLNNNIDVGSYYNRTCDVNYIEPNILSRNLDYFYRIGNLSGSTGPLYYLNQFSNIQTEYISKIEDETGYSQNGGNGFNISVYFEKDAPSNYDFDYFNFYFNNKMTVKDGGIYYDKIYKKFSEFSYGSNYSPSITIFRGVKIKIYEVVNVIRNSFGKIYNIITKTSDKFNGYKFSIILNDIYYTEDGYTYVNGITNYLGFINIVNNGIHIIINNKYKNILVIINVNIHLSGTTMITFNHADICGEKYGLYTNKKLNGETISTDYDPYILTAFNFTNAINNLNDKYGFDNYITYYYIDEEDGITITGSTLMNDNINATIPKFLLRIEKPDSLLVKKDSYIVTPVQGPNYKKLYKGKSLSDIKIIDEPLSRKITTLENIEGINKSIFRYNGPYEPIFKDINIFDTAKFCYTEFLPVDYSGKTWTPWSVAGIAKSVNLYETNWLNPQYAVLCDDTTKSRYCYLNVKKNNTITLSILYSYSFSFPQINYDDDIEGIELEITRKNESTHYNVSDYYITISSGTSFLTDYGENRAIAGIWNTNWSAVTYGNSGDTWGFSGLNGSIVNSNNFYALIMVNAENTDPIDHIMAQIKCIKMRIYYKYTLTGITYEDFSYFDENIVFDDTLTNFGILDEVIHSKVNHLNNNILKFDDDNHYPMVDQFGYSYEDRFIFKSTWDKEYYYKTIDGFTDDNIKYIKYEIRPTSIKDAQKNMTNPA